jgi:hypothetical protein
MAVENFCAIVASQSRALRGLKARLNAGAKQILQCCLVSLLPGFRYSHGQIKKAVAISLTLVNTPWHSS